MTPYTTHFSTILLRSILQGGGHGWTRYITKTLIVMLPPVPSPPPPSMSSHGHSADVSAKVPITTHTHTHGVSPPPSSTALPSAMWKRVGILVDAALPVCVKHQKAHTDQVRCLAVRIGLPEQVQLVKSLLLLDDVCYTIEKMDSAAHTDGLCPAPKSASKSASHPHQKAHLICMRYPSDQSNV